MAESYKYQAIQGGSSITDYRTLYSTDASKTAVVSTIAIANTSPTTAATFRVALMGSAGSPAATDGILAWDTNVPATETYFLTIGVALGNTNFIRVSSSASTVTFTAFISEIT